MNAYRRRLIALIVALMLLTAVTQSTSAHAILIRSDPIDGAVLIVAPRDVNLWFDEPISPEFSSVQVFDINTQPIEITDIRADPNDSHHLAFSFPDELSPGVYSVLYRALSEADGHFSQGLLIFGVGEDADLNAAAVSETETPPPGISEVGLRWLNFTLLAGVVGALAIVHIVIRPSRSGAEVASVMKQARRRIVGWAAWCALLAVLAGAGLLFRQTQLLIDTLPAGVTSAQVGWQIISRTRWGLLWAGRQVVLLILSVTLFSLYRHNPFAKEKRIRFIWLFAGILMLSSLVLQSLMGHAAAVSANIDLAIVVDSLHMLAAGVWIGGLLALAVGLIPLLRRHRAALGALIRAGWAPFGWLAAISVGLLFATGLYNTGQQVASIDALITTLYGRAVLGKIGLLLAVGVFGFVNSMLLHPRVAAPLARLMRRPKGWTPLSLRQLPKLALIEVGLGVMVFLVTGLLTATPAPRGLEYTIVSEDVPDALSQTVDDVFITLYAKPNRPGQNVFTVFAASSRRPAPAEIIRVIVRFTYLDEDLGRVSVNAEEVGRDRYLVTGNYLSLAGPWQVDVVVRREGMEDSVAQFDWVVAPTGETSPVVVSKTPIEAPLTIAAAVLILVMLSVAIVIRFRQGSGRIEKKMNFKGQNLWTKHGV